MATKEEIERAAKSQGTESLPPAGHGRDEALRMREACLEERAEVLKEQMLMGTVPDKYKKIDRHIYQKTDMLRVSDGKEDKHYRWVNYQGDHGSHVERAKLQGYEVVSGKGPDYPEVRECLVEDGSRRIGDVLLMRCPLEVAIKRIAEERAEAAKRKGVLFDSDALAEMAMRHTDGRIKIHTSLSDEHVRMAEQRAHQIRMNEERAYARLGRRLEGGKVVDPSHFAGRL